MGFPVNLNEKPTARVISWSCKKKLFNIHHVEPWCPKRLAWANQDKVGANNSGIPSKSDGHSSMIIKVQQGNTARLAAMRDVVQADFQTKVHIIYLH